MKNNLSESEILNKTQGLEKFISLCNENKFTNILDIGSGKIDKHSNIMRNQGLNVETVDFFSHNTYKGDYNKIQIEKQFDGIWCHHTLEHQLNVNIFLTKIFNNAKDNGIVCITVPPSKPRVVGGHVTLWNAGLLLYNMILAGFDCSEAKVKTYGYNVCVIVKKKEFVCPQLTYDTLDVKEILKPYFPIKYEGNGFDGNIQELNWT